MACLCLPALAGVLPGDREIFEKMYEDTLKKEKDFYRPDPYTGILHKPFVHFRVPWPEHPSGALEIVTNGMGFRADAPTIGRKTPGAFRILITGDSHTDGLVYNAESFSKLIEDGLNRGSRIRACETINAGVGHFSFRNYLGLLRRYRFLKPDVFIVTVYSGNDFLEAAEYLEYNETVPGPKPYAARLAEAEKLNEGAVWQALNQAVYFKSFPEMGPRVMKLAQDSLGEIRDLCRADGIRLLVILLPTKLDVEWDSDRIRLESVKSSLGLSDSDLRINATMRQAMGDWLAKERIPFLDAGRMLPKGEPGSVHLFWNEDYHLSKAGHRWIADLVLRERTTVFKR
jgi:hypothetical protein